MAFDFLPDGRFIILLSLLVVVLYILATRLTSTILTQALTRALKRPVQVGAVGFLRVHELVIGNAGDEIVLRIESATIHVYVARYLTGQGSLMAVNVEGVHVHVTARANNKPTAVSPSKPRASIPARAAKLVEFLVTRIHVTAATETLVVDAGIEKLTVRAHAIRHTRNPSVIVLAVAMNTQLALQERHGQKQHFVRAELQHASVQASLPLVGAPLPPARVEIELSSLGCEVTGSLDDLAALVVAPASRRAGVKFQDESEAASEDDATPVKLHRLATALPTDIVVHGTRMAVHVHPWAIFRARDIPGVRSHPASIAAGDVRVSLRKEGMPRSGEVLEHAQLEAAVALQDATLTAGNPARALLSVERASCDVRMGCKVTALPGGGEAPVLAMEPARLVVTVTTAAPRILLDPAGRAWAVALRDWQLMRAATRPAPPRGSAGSASGGPLAMLEAFPGSITVHVHGQQVAVVVAEQVVLCQLEFDTLGCRVNISEASRVSKPASDDGMSDSDSDKGEQSQLNDRIRAVLQCKGFHLDFGERKPPPHAKLATFDSSTLTIASSHVLGRALSVDSISIVSSVGIPLAAARRADEHVPIELGLSTDITGVLAEVSDVTEAAARAIAAAITLPPSEFATPSTSGSVSPSRGSGASPVRFVKLAVNLRRAGVMLAEDASVWHDKRNMDAHLALTVERVSVEHHPSHHVTTKASIAEAALWVAGTADGNDGAAFLAPTPRSPKVLGWAAVPVVQVSSVAVTQRQGSPAAAGDNQASVAGVAVAIDVDRVLSLVAAAEWILSRGAELQSMNAPPTERAHTAAVVAGPTWALEVTEVDVELTISQDTVWQASVAIVTGDVAKKHIILDTVTVALEGARLLSWKTLTVDILATVPAGFPPAAAARAVHTGDRPKHCIALDFNEGIIEVAREVLIGQKLQETVQITKRIIRDVKLAVGHFLTLDDKSGPPKEEAIALRLSLQNTSFIVIDDEFESQLAVNYELNTDDHMQRMQREKQVLKRLAEHQMPLTDELRFEMDRKHAELYISRVKFVRANRPDRAPLMQLGIGSLEASLLISLLDTRPPETVVALVRDVAGASLPDGSTFDTAVGLDLMAAAGEVRVTLRDFPEPLVAGVELRVAGPLLVIQRRAAEPGQVKHTVHYGSSRQFTATSHMTPTMIFQSLKIDCNDLVVNWTPSLQATLSDVSDAVTRLSTKSSDPSPPLPWWDKLRYMLHGPLSFTTHGLTLRLSGDRTPYTHASSMEMAARHVVIEAQPGSVLVRCEALIMTQTLGTETRSVLELPTLTFRVEMSWECLGDPSAHFLVAAVRPELRTEATEDTFVKYRSHSLSINLDVGISPVHMAFGATPRSVTSVLSLDISRVPYIQAWAKRFSQALSLPVRRGPYFLTPREKKQSFSGCIKEVRAKLSVEALEIQLWDSPSRVTGTVSRLATLSASLAVQQRVKTVVHALLAREVVRRKWTVLRAVATADSLTTRIFTPEGMEVFLNLHMSGAFEADAYTGELLFQAPLIEYKLDRGARELSADASVEDMAAGLHKVTIGDLRLMWTEDVRNRVYLWYDRYRSYQGTRPAWKEEMELATAEAEAAQDTAPMQVAATPVPSETQEAPVTTATAPAAAAPPEEENQLLSFLLSTSKGSPKDVLERRGSEATLDTTGLNALRNYTVELVNPQFNMLAPTIGSRGYILLVANSVRVVSDTFLHGGDANDRTRVEIAFDKMEWLAAPMGDTTYEPPQWVMAQQSEEDTGLRRITEKGAMNMTYVYYDNTLPAASDEVSSLAVTFPHLAVNLAPRQYDVLLDVINTLLLGQPAARLEEREKLQNALYENQLDPETKKGISGAMERVRQLCAQIDQIQKNLAAARADPVNHAEDIQKWRATLEKRRRRLRRERTQLNALTKAARLRDTSRATPIVKVDVSIAEARWVLFDDRPSAAANAASVLTPLSSITLSRANGFYSASDDGSCTAWMEIGAADVANLMPGSIFPVALSRGAGLDHLEAIVRVYWRQGAPVGGIPIYEHFEVNVAPLVVALTSEFYGRFFAYFFPPEEFVMVSPASSTTVTPLISPASALATPPVPSMSPAAAPMTSPASASVRDWSVGWGAAQASGTPTPTEHAPTGRKLSGGSGHRRQRSSEDGSTAKNAGKGKGSAEESKKPKASLRRDVDQMRDRAKKNQTFNYFKITSIPLQISYRDQDTKTSMRDLDKVSLRLAEICVQGVTYSWHNLWSEVEDRIKGAILGQIFNIILPGRGKEKHAGDEPEPKKRSIFDRLLSRGKQPDAAARPVDADTQHAAMLLGERATQSAAAPPEASTTDHGGRSRTDSTKHK